VEVLKTDNDIRTFPRVNYIYNPIDDGLLPFPNQQIDKNKLVFFSSPHKGLKHALPLFKNLRTHWNKDFKLYVANPGYLVEDWGQHEGVINLGPLSHQEALKHVRESLCVFYPNFIFPETFGLVIAEANAVGVPVLTHPRGAIPEVISGHWQMTDCRIPKQVIDKVMAWYKEPPRTEGRTDFRLTVVLERWKKVLDL
jgi:glycosyltransferase involved in cell wall biosynthesis